MVIITCRLILHNLVIYWRSLFAIVYPLALLPVFVVVNKPETRCLYVVLIMAGFWVFEILPLAVTGLIPVALFPVMGVMDTKTTSLCYFKDSNMMFVGGLMIALAVEFCGLHERMALIVLKCIGCSFRRLSFGLSTITMFVSMWISNTAATAMMIPIIQAILQQMEAQGLAPVFEPRETPGTESPKIPEETDDSDLRPTKTTMCFYIGTAYAATIGGMGCLVGSGTNLAFRGIYETEFKHSPGIGFTQWLLCNTPIMLALNYLGWFYMQIWYMGLFRPKSKDGKRVNLGKESATIVRGVIVNKLRDLGKMSFHEILVAMHFILAVCLWFFLKPGFLKGWGEMLTKRAVIGDSTAALIVVVMLFMWPAKPDFIYMFSKDEEKRPKTRAPALVTWKYIQDKMNWGLIFLMGGGFAIAEASKKSGMGIMMANQLELIKNWNKYGILCMVCLGISFITQFTSSVAMGNILLPVAANLCRKSKIHPMYLMMPISLQCSAAFCLPVSTPPNGIAAGPSHMSTFEMIKIGAVMQILFYLVLIAIFPLMAPLVWSDINEYPKWADKH